MSASVPEIIDRTAPTGLVDHNLVPETVVPGILYEKRPAKAPDGTVAWCEIFNLYEVDDEGKITLLRSFWDFEAMQQTAF